MEGPITVHHDRVKHTIRAGIVKASSHVIESLAIVPFYQSELAKMQLCLKKKYMNKLQYNSLTGV